MGEEVSKGGQRLDNLGAGLESRAGSWGLFQVQWEISRRLQQRRDVMVFALLKDASFSKYGPCIRMTWGAFHKAEPSLFLVSAASASLGPAWELHLSKALTYWRTAASGRNV